MRLPPIGANGTPDLKQVRRPKLRKSKSSVSLVLLQETPRSQGGQRNCPGFGLEPKTPKSAPGARRSGSSSRCMTPSEDSTSCYSPGSSRDGTPATVTTGGKAECETFCWSTMTLPRTLSTPSTLDLTTGPMPGHWRCGAQIGLGSYGSVYRALDVANGRIFAVKKTAISSEDDGSTRCRAEQELLICEGLQHPNIVAYLGHEFQGPLLCIFMEFVPGSSLAAVLQEFGPLDGPLLQTSVRGILLGLNYLHDHNPPVVHRDIKAANVLLDLDFNVKLADFGCSKKGDLTTSFTTVGSIPWMAPEVILQKDGYGRKADIWSLGCTVIEMATAEQPWGKGVFDNAIFALQHIAMSEEIPTIPKKLSQACHDLVSRCLQRNAVLRPTSSELLQHAFVSPIDMLGHGLARKTPKK